MIPAIIRFAVRQRLLVLFLVGIMVAAGLYSAAELPLDAVPDVTNVQVQILTSAPALAALEAEQQITFPVEVAMSGLPGVTQIRSVSLFGLSAVTVVFTDATNIYAARQLVQERLAQAREQIPPSAGVPEMGPIATGLGEIFQYELSAAPGSGYDLKALRTVQDWDVRRQLLTVPGITEVNSFGGLELQYQVRVDPRRLQAYALTLRDVYDAVAQNNANVGGGYIEHGSEQYVLRGVGLATSTADLGRIVVKTGPEGVPVYVSDLAEVVEDAAQRQGALTAQGNGEVVGGIAIMLLGENSRLAAQRVRQRIEEIRPTLPRGVSLAAFYDRSLLVDATIRTVGRNLLEGAALVILVLIVLLGHWRGAVLVATIIPLSMLFAVVLMRAFNVSGNLMSLGALDFGLIVDGAVVMVENAVRRRAQAQREGATHSPQTTVLEACLEVGRPVVFAVGIIIIVYLPILSLMGIEGRMFRPMALTVVFALAGSLLLSLTYVPAALTFVLSGPVSERESPFMRVARRWYRPGLDRVMRHRAIAVVSVVALLAVSLGVFRLLGAEFIPRLDEGSVSIEARVLPSASLSEAIRVYSAAERSLRQFPEVTNVVSKIGRAEIATDPQGVDAADMYIALRPREQWTSASSREQLVEKMSETLEREVPQANFSFSQPIEMRMSELISGVRSDVAIKVFGDDLLVLRNLANQVAKAAGAVRGAADVKIEQVAGLPQLEIKSDRAAIARHGVNIEDVNALVEALGAGQEAGVVHQGERRLGLVVRLDPAASQDLEAIRNLVVPSPNRALVPLSELAAITLVQGPAQVSREDARRRIAVELNVRGRDLRGFVSEAQRRVAAQVPLPPGYYLAWGGQFENLQRASARLLIVVPLALFLIFVLLFAAFDSVKQALIVYTGVPFAVVGGVFALAVRGLPFSISAGVGFIALFGVAVLNGVVMVSFINQLREGGEPIGAAVVRGAEARLRPVLMTALVASLGFIPMAVATSAGAEVQRPLATVVIGGLVTSTILTLLILPTLYQWFVQERT
jgi:heavy metal efflux system protein